MSTAAAAEEERAIARAFEEREEDARP